MTQAQQFLDEAYEALDLKRGELIDASLPRSDERWVDKGDWAALASHVGADKVFFVKGNPVAVFAKQDSDDPDTLRRLFGKVWCMSRPNLLFLASPGCLAVYDLTEAPAHDVQEWKRRKPLDIARDVSEVARELKAYHRAQIETGKLFEERRFGGVKQRADKALIQDLRSVRAALMKEGLAGEKLKYAHALIGRSIFIRYLEDRGVLGPEYFRQVARGNRTWRNILDKPAEAPSANPAARQSCYIKVLGDKDFAYALFGRLSKDFNGDMFPEDEQEDLVVTQRHLDILQGLLRGDTGDQQKLFFWAYQFSIIPIELVSSIYEEFYTATGGSKDGKGTHYTPSALVEFVLSQILTPERLRENPVVLDPACGSGIFLVETFRRIVRHRQVREGRRLSAPQLRKILRDQIRGIDINEEAIRVAAFSLYLALLHYQEPKDILEQIKHGYRLPCLVSQETKRIRRKDVERFNILQAANAFSVEADTKADVVVGNPPWGDAPRKDKEGRAQAEVALEWCASRGLPVGDRERSQAFIWRALDFLKEAGAAGLLVSSGILHKHGNASKDFRKKWLGQVRLGQIVHFAHVRHVFFPSASAPFGSLVFTLNQGSVSRGTFMYASAKKTGIVDGTQSVVIGKDDIHYLRQDDMVVDDDSWKLLWWGNHHDRVLVNALRARLPLGQLVDRENSGQGYKRASASEPARWLSNYRELPLESVTRYGPLDLSGLRPVPQKVERRGVRGAYSGLRLLVRQGISEGAEPKGQVIARLVDGDFCFTNSVNCIRLRQKTPEHYAALLGIVWSSLARYYLFLTSSAWGLWHNQLHLDEILSLPVELAAHSRAYDEAVNCVTELSELPESAIRDDSRVKSLERRLDEAVFDLFGLSDSERDLIRDMCNIGIPYFYDPRNSRGACPLTFEGLERRQGTLDSLVDVENADDRTDIRGYLVTFLRIWNRELEPRGEFAWRVIAPGYPTPMVAAVFSTQNRGDEPALPECSDDEWRNLLRHLASDLLAPFYGDRVYLDGLVRVVTPTEIVVIKRNEGRLWTRSAAREDAEATLLKATYLDDDTGAPV